MRFTAQEEYGLRCLLQIARAPVEGLTIPEIAGREALSTAYVAKLMRILRQAEVVKSTRGQKGGYQLVGAPDQISVGTILRALGGRLYSQEFCGCHTGIDDVCVHNLDCSIRALWVALDSAVDRALSKMMLSDLLCSEQDMASRIQPHLSANPAAAAGAIALARRM